MSLRKFGIEKSLEYFAPEAEAFSMEEIIIRWLKSENKYDISEKMFHLQATDEAEKLLLDNQLAQRTGSDLISFTKDKASVLKELAIILDKSLS